MRKTSFLAFIAAGVLFLAILVRDLLTLGPEMLKKASFPSDISAKLIPGIQIDPIVAATLVISGGIKISICTYAAVMAISQLLKLDDYNVFVLPVTAIIVSISIWSYDSYIHGVQWIPQEWTMYSFPFQVIIPVILLVISLFKRYSKSKEHFR